MSLGTNVLENVVFKMLRKTCFLGQILVWTCRDPGYNHKKEAYTAGAFRFYYK